MPNENTNHLPRGHSSFSFHIFTANHGKTKKISYICRNIITAKLNKKPTKRNKTINYYGKSI